MAQIKSICPTETDKLRNKQYWFHYSNLAVHQQSAELAGWTFYVVDQSRGYCRVSDKIITIPLWCVKRASTKQGQERLIQYILHEMAHALDWTRGNKKLGHGASFMKCLIEICPAELLVYEMSYKPRNLVAAGAIFCPESLNF